MSDFEAPDVDMPTPEAEAAWETEQLFARLTRLVFRLQAEDGHRADLEIGDLDLYPVELARLRRHAARVRSACDTISRAVATEWIERWGESEMVLDGDLHVTASTKTRRGWRINPDETAGFADWLRSLDDEEIVAMISGLRVSKMGAGRDTFMLPDEAPGLSVTVTAISDLPPRTQQRVDRLPVNQVIPKGRAVLSVVPDPEATAERLAQDVPF